MELPVLIDELKLAIIIDDAEIAIKMDFHSLAGGKSVSVDFKNSVLWSYVVSWYSVPASILRNKLYWLLEQ